MRWACVGSPGEGFRGRASFAMASGPRWSGQPFGLGRASVYPLDRVGGTRRSGEEIAAVPKGLAPIQGSPPSRCSQNARPSGEHGLIEHLLAHHDGVEGAFPGGAVAMAENSGHKGPPSQSSPGTGLAVLSRLSRSGCQQFGLEIAGGRGTVASVVRESTPCPPRHVAGRFFQSPAADDA